MRLTGGTHEQLDLPSLALKGTWLAGLFAAGGAVALLDLVTPSWSEGSTGVRAALGVTSLGIALVVFLARDRIGRRAQHVALLLGVAMVTAQIWNDGPEPFLFADALFYSWVLALAFAFNPLPVALRYVAFIAVALGLVFAADWQEELATSWIVVMVALVVPAIVTGYLFGQVQRLAMQDALTGLFNRRAFMALLHKQLAQNSRRHSGLALVVLDVDDLKAVNDRGGHAAGDGLLRQAAGRWSGALREGDVLARIGGDEFGLLLVDCPTRDHAAEVLGRVHDRGTGISASVGCALWRGETADALLANADHALYLAKQRGKNRIVFAVEGAPPGRVHPA